MLTKRRWPNMSLDDAEQAWWSAPAHLTNRPLRVPKKNLSPSQALDREVSELQCKWLRGRGFEPMTVRLGPVAELVGIEVGVVSGVMNLESSGVEASDWRLRHDQGYHEARFLAACDRAGC